MQQINLYQGSTQKAAPLCGGSHFVKGSLGLIILLFILTLVGVWQTSQLRSDFARSQERLEAVAAETRVLAAQNSEIAVDLSLQKTLANSNRMKTAMQQLSDYLTDSRSKRAQGFSAYFEGLARQTVPNVWFSGITINDGGQNIKMKGSTLQARRVPKLLQLLKEEQAFRGKVFSRLMMDQPENTFGQVDFSIDTKPLEEPTRGGA